MGQTAFTKEDVHQFIRALAWLSVYRMTPQCFFDSEMASRMRLPSSNFSEFRFKSFLQALSRGSHRNIEKEWNRPFQEDRHIREMEAVIAEVSCRIAFVLDKTIISKDDDQYRLSSKRNEDVGLVRVRNPKKAFGPVSTGSVSLCIGVTLATRLSGAKEDLTTTIQTLLCQLLNERHPDRIASHQPSNLIAMDRGYLSQDLIDWLVGCGFHVIGTHKRVPNFPFTFGDQKPTHGRKHVMEKGAQSTYWCRNGNNKHALAFRQGNGHVATLIYSGPDTSRARKNTFVYVPKRVPANDEVCEFEDGAKELLLQHEGRCYEILTKAQGGLDWHIVRTGYGCLTSTIAFPLLKSAQQKIRPQYDSLLLSLGIQPNAPVLDSPENLAAKTKAQLVSFLRVRRLPVTGNKTQLVERLENWDPSDLPDETSLLFLKKELLSKWFLKPLKNSSAFKVGHRNEHNITTNVASFLESHKDDLTKEGVPKSLEVSALASRGVLASKHHNVLCTSPDQLAVVVEKRGVRAGSLGAEYRRSRIAYLEYKTMTVANTSSSSKGRLERARNHEEANPEQPLFQCEFDSDWCRELVWTPQYRTQLLHHAAVCDVDLCLFVVADTKTILYVVAVEFSDRL